MVEGTKDVLGAIDPTTYPDTQTNLPKKHTAARKNDMREGKGRYQVVVGCVLQVYQLPG